MRERLHTAARALARFAKRAWFCWMTTVLLGAAWTLYSGAVQERGAHETLARWSYTLPFRMAGIAGWRPALATLPAEQRPADTVIPEVLLVEINNATTQNLDYRVDRANYVRLLERLVAAAPRLVFFDLVFIGPNPHSDEALLRAFDAIDPWIVGAAMERIPSDAGRFTRVSEVSAFALDETVRSIPELMRDGHWGYLDLRRDRDGCVRALDAFTPRFDHRHPDNATAAWRAAELVGAAETAEPSARQRPRWLNYYGPPFPHNGPPAFARRELSQVLAMPADECERLFANKFVFVGIRRDLQPGAASAPADVFPHPWGAARCAGMEIQATAVMNLVRGDWLRRVPAARQLAIVVLWGTLLVALLTWSRSPASQAAGLLGCAALAAASIRAQLQPGGGAWWPWLVPVLIQTPWALLTSAWVPAWRARRKLVFISYRSADGMELARHLKTTLESLDIPAFMEKDAIRAGVAYPQALERALRRAPNLLLVLTPGAREALRQEAAPPALPAFQDDPGRWIPREVRVAREAGNHIVLLLPTRAIPGPAPQPADSDPAPAPDDSLRARELPEDLRFLAEIAPVRFRSDEFHASSVQQLVEALSLPRRVRIRVTRHLRDQEDLRMEDREEMSSTPTP